MANPFYEALSTEDYTGQELNTSVQNGLMPFRHYINNSITAFRDKEIECAWHPVNRNSYKLQFINRIFEVIPYFTLKLQQTRLDWYQIVSEDDGTLLDSDFEADISEPIIIGKGKSRKSIKLGEDDYEYQNNIHTIKLSKVEPIEIISWLGYQLKIAPITPNLSKRSDVKINGIRYEIDKHTKSTLTLKGQITSNAAKVLIDNHPVEFEIIEQFDPDSLSEGRSELINKADFWYLVALDKPKDHSQCKVRDITKEVFNNIDLTDLQVDDEPLQSKQWKLSKSANQLILEAKDSIDEKLSGIRLSTHPQLELRIEEQQSKEKWIQLIEPENDDSTQSALDYFFSEDASILDANKYGAKNDYYFIVKMKPDERQLLLSDSRKTRNTSIYPRHKVIKAKANILQLKRQQEAIDTLKKAPSNFQKGLVSLFISRKIQHWKTYKEKKLNENEWQVLTDTGFDGCTEQRSFVCKALATPDFAILDGPPGTGKTTAILELIVQLIRRGKKVLLTASTHAAINNVLERIDSNNLQGEVFPLRIGDIGSAQGVEHYQFDNQLQSVSHELDKACSKQILFDSSNLVCGTTIGIVRLFNDSDIHIDKYTSAFDVMIIDECSKTPLQEFLVPARYAEKHILVGDIRQLSPFTDRGQIVANLENLLLKPGNHRKNIPDITLDNSLQEACYLLEKLRRGNNRPPYSHRFVKVVSSAVIKSLSEELDVRIQNKKHNQGLDKILIVGLRYGKKPSDLKRNSAPFWIHNLCFIEDTCYSEIKSLIPPDMIILEENWFSLSQAFIHQKYFSKSQDYTHQNKRRNEADKINDADAIYKAVNGQLNSSSWADEICWRLERLYWLRLSQGFDKKTRNFKNIIERLIPKSVNAEGRVFSLQNIAFPSVLEALSGDGLQKRKNDLPNTINQGFAPDEKRVRYTTLTYQHRMHPDISSFPGKQFYKGKSLQNGNHVATRREWAYPRYKKHSIWLDVPKSLSKAKVYKNQNQAEVDSIMEELKHFCDWAKAEKNDEKRRYSVAILTFYKGQEKALRSALQTISGDKRSYARFNFQGITIKLATVDYFQGQEADLVFLSMVNNERDGFLDSPNRLNVAITRARYQLVVVGSYDYFSTRSRTDELKNLAISNKLFSRSKAK